MGSGQSLLYVNNYCNSVNCAVQIKLLLLLFDSLVFQSLQPSAILEAVVIPQCYFVNYQG